MHLKCLRTFEDSKKVTRRNGEEWLVKMSDTETYIPGVYEEVVGVVNITTLSNRQYCVVLNPVDEDGRPQLSKKKLIRVSRYLRLYAGYTQVIQRLCAGYAQAIQRLCAGYAQAIT